MTTYQNTTVPLVVAVNGGGGPPDYLDFPWNVENELERLKNRLLREALQVEVPAAVIAPLRRAANEAAAIAWLEPHPLLAFPELFREIAAAAVRRAVGRRTTQNSGAAAALVLVKEAA